MCAPLGALAGAGSWGCRFTSSVRGGKNSKEKKVLPSEINFCIFSEIFILPGSRASRKTSRKGRQRRVESLDKRSHEAHWCCPLRPCPARHSKVMAVRGGSPAVPACPALRCRLPAFLTAWME